MISVALANIPQTKEERYGSLTELSPELPLLGPAFLARYLKRHGHDVVLFDHVHLSMQESIDILEDFDVVGFSVYIVNYVVAMQMARELKRRNPDLVIVFGGPHATLFHPDFNGGEVDYLVAGEGEIPLLEILNALKEKREPLDLPGLYRSRGGELVGSGKADPVDNLDEIGPPDVGQYDLSNYHPPSHVLGNKVIHTLSSRGCPFKCSFCAASELMSRRIRYRSIESILDELLKYKSVGYDSVIFYDDIFTLDRRRVIDLCREMISRKLNMKWTCFTRTQCVDKDLCDLMRRAGCYLVTFGCESANDKTLNLLRKGLTQEVNSKGIDIASQSGLLTSSSFMIGLPGESEIDIIETIQYARRSRLLFAVFPIFEPFKGTPIYDTCLERGSWHELEGQANTLLPSQAEVWVPDTMQREDVVRLAGKAFFSFYFYPPRLLRLAHYLFFRMPLRRSWRLLRGGVRFFLNVSRRKTSQHMTHY